MFFEIGMAYRSGITKTKSGGHSDFAFQLFTYGPPEESGGKSLKTQFTMNITAITRVIVVVLAESLV